LAEPRRYPEGVTCWAKSLGGTVLNRGDTEWTRDALLRDPQGALFTVSQFTPPTQPG
jgi:hypothetical protein